MNKEGKEESQIDMTEESQSDGKQSAAADIFVDHLKQIKDILTNEGIDITGLTDEQLEDYLSNIDLTNVFKDAHPVLQQLELSGDKFLALLQDVKEDMSIKDYLLNHNLHLKDVIKYSDIIKLFIDNLDVGKELAPYIPRLLQVMLSYAPSDAVQNQIDSRLDTIESEFEQNDLTVAELASSLVGIAGSVIGDIVSQDTTAMVDIISDLYYDIYQVRPEWINNIKAQLTDSAVTFLVATLTGFDLKSGTFKGGVHTQSSPQIELLFYLIANAMGRDNWAKFVGGLAGAAPALDAFLTYGVSITTLVKSILSYGELALSGKESDNLSFIVDKSGDYCVLISVGPLHLSLAIDPLASIAPVQYRIDKALSVAEKRGVSVIGKIFASIFNIGVKIVNTGLGLYNDAVSARDFKAFKEYCQNNYSALEQAALGILPKYLEDAFKSNVKTLCYESLDLLISLAGKRLAIVLRDEASEESVVTQGSTDSTTTQTDVKLDDTSHGTEATVSSAANYGADIAPALLSSVGRASHGEPTVISPHLVPGILGEDDAYIESVAPGRRFKQYQGQARRAK